MTITERVERGAALLDEKRPLWWQEIDLERLDIRSPCGCVATQAAGRDFLDAMENLGIGGERDSVAHGFEADDYLSVDAFRAEYAALTKAWRALIESRRAAVSVTV